MGHHKIAARFGALSLLCAGLAAPAFADSGDTAWILTSTALVLFMTLPGLALFYGGLVQAKNLLSVFMQCMAVAALMSLVWLFFGYSIAFGPGEGGVFGGFAKSFAAGITGDPLEGQTIPEPLFLMFQMTFAIITPALIIGAFVERVNFAAMLVFCALWLLICYAPVAHWVWGGGWLAGMGVIDFAGGIVVHTTAGISALVFALILGKRAHFPQDMRPPHSPGFVMLGAAMLWVGWFGFNAGSALGANADAARAMLVTHTSAATAALVWMGIEWVSFRKPTLVGIATGMVAGLATITPAAGSVGPVGALIIGTASAFVCYYAVGLIRQKLKIDDSLDVFAVHGVGGMLGSLLIPFLAALGPLAPGISKPVFAQLGVQLLGVGVVAMFSAIVTAGLLYAIRTVIPLRVSREDEESGLDSATHGESAYHQ
ncbi:MAG: ammonium transporter [Hyphomonas sp.]|uniref:ammonium transporter n=1 Tax=Hyphomonas sp. TaxID=87 RepID=UPI0035278D12